MFVTPFNCFDGLNQLQSDYSVKKLFLKTLIRKNKLD